MMLAVPDLTWGIVVAFGPIVALASAVIGGGIVAAYIHHVVLPKLAHITEMTNSAHANALKRIQELEKEIGEIKTVVKPQ